MKSIRSSILVSAAATLFCSSVSAQITAVWQRPGDGNWTDPSKWFRTFPPPAGPLGTFPDGSQYDAIIDHEKAMEVRLDQSISLNSLDLGMNTRLLGPADLSLTRLDLNGTLSSGLNVVLNGTLNAPTNRWGVVSSSTLSINGSVTGRLGSQMNGKIKVVEGSELSLMNGRIWNLDRGNGLPGEPLLNAGTIRAISGYNDIEMPLSHSPGSQATVSVSAGTLDLWGPISGVAQYSAAAGSTLSFGQGELPVGGRISGDGVVRFISGGFRVAGEIDVTGRVQLQSSATLQLDRPETTIKTLHVVDGDPTIRANGTLTILEPLRTLGIYSSRTTFAGSGVTHLAGGGVLVREPKISDHTLINHSLLELNDAQITVDGTATLINSVGGRVQVSGISGLKPSSYTTPPSGTLENRGEIRFVSGSTFDAIRWNFTNSGSITVEKGAAARFRNTLQCNGTINVGNSAILELLNSSGQPWSADLSAVSVAPTGTLVLGTMTSSFAAAPLTVTSPVSIGGSLTTLYGPVIFLQDVKASVGDIDNAQFQGSAQFSTLKADGSLVFTGVDNYIGTLTSGDLVNTDVSGELNIGTYAVVRGNVGGSGITRIDCVEPDHGFSKVGSGTLIIGRVARLGGSSADYSAYGGTTIFLGPMTQPGAPRSLVVRSAEVRLGSSEYISTTWTEMGGKIVLLPGNNKVLRTSGSASPTFLRLDGSMDLTDNGLIVDYSSSSPFGLLLSYFISGYAGGAWNGNGIISSSALADPRIGIGVAEASDVFGPNGGTFFNESVDGTTALMRATLKGDADLNGVVNISDFARVARAFNTQSLWSSGDFNYDFRTDVADFALLASNFNTSLPIASSRQSVPEPSAFAVAVLATLPLRRRR